MKSVLRVVVCGLSFLLAADASAAGNACANNADCTSLEYCASPEGQCGGGVCAARGVQVLCMNSTTPVCGCDLNTYQNGCLAKKAGVSLASEGPCTRVGVVPFLMQFADTYDVAQPSSTGLVTLTLDPLGSYTATFADGSSESGTYTSYASPTLPFTFFLTSGSNWWSGRIVDYSGNISFTRDSATDTATPRDTVGPNESICDASGGQWTDDDADAATGLFCLCPAGTPYVPSQGGCVAID